MRTRDMRTSETPGDPIGGRPTMLAQPLVAVGDRYEMNVSLQALREGRLVLEPAVSGLLAAPPAEIIVEADAKPARVRHDPVAGALLGSALRPLARRPGRVVLECLSTSPPRFRVTAEPSSDVALPDVGVLATESGVALALSAEDARLIRDELRGAAGAGEFRLSLQAARLAMVEGFDRLLCLPFLRDVELLEHQLRTAHTVLRQLRGRALLCDEVGLGKTIEAGIVLLELVVRRLVRRVLILTPPSLVEQWQGEMRRKFGLDFVTHDDPAFREHGERAWRHYDHIIASSHTARRDPHRSAVLSCDWDVVIVDEAHHCRRRETLLWHLVAELRKQYLLLLTATPVQNDLEELFTLVTLLQPGLLSTARSFHREFVDRRDRLVPRNVDRLHALLREAIVRNTRATVNMSFTRRLAHTETVTLDERERALYGEASHFVREHLRQGGARRGLSRMLLLTVQKELGSLTCAAAPTLDRVARHADLPPAVRRRAQALAEAAAQTDRGAKADRLLRLLRDFPDKVVIFTQFRETQRMLERHLGEAGIEVSCFHGGLSRLQKEDAVRRFQGPARILLSTDAGSEGRNLQFCHAVCNFDLPWNPMKIEQRIGRLSRIGQTRDVHVFNLVAAETLEAALLHLLEAKIAMFELVIGEIDVILGNLDEEQEFEDVVADLWVQADGAADFRTALDRLGDRLAAAKAAYIQQRMVDERLFGGQFRPAG
jgi:SNF2 family DNA or RNA helicase